MSALSEELVQSVEQGASAVLATVIEVEGSVRIEPGAKCLVRDGRVRAENIGDARAVQAILEESQACLRAEKSQLVALTLARPEDKLQVFFDVMPAPARLIVVGAGHIAVPLVKIAKVLDFHVTVIDDRSLYANREDRDPDLLLTGVTPGTPAVPITGLYLNQGATFTPAPLDTPGLCYSAAAWGDFDNDGDLDLALSGATNLAASPSNDARYTALFRHDLPPVASPPPAPINLAATVQGSRVSLSWALPPLAPAGLSFNVQVGTAPGRSDVLSAPAHALTGQLRLAQHGNVGWSGRWRLSNLPPGTYYRSVVP